MVTLTNGDLTYDSDDLGIGPLSSVVDTFSYTVTDQLGDQASGTVNVTVTNPIIVTNGTLALPNSSTASLTHYITSAIDAMFPATETLVQATAAGGTISGSLPDVVYTPFTQPSGSKLRGAGPAW